MSYARPLFSTSSGIGINLVNNVGSIGLAGLTNSTSLISPTGPTGPAGGAQGNTSTEGTIGPTGLMGATGLVGKTGSQGLPGEKGNNGINGATGYTGESGINGATGDTGTPYWSLDSNTLFPNLDSYNIVIGKLSSSSTNYALDISGNVIISKNLTVDTNTLFVDSSNNRVGIGTSNPTYALDVTGNLKTTMDTNINTITVGKGGGNVSSNTAIGNKALIVNTGSSNTSVGNQSLIVNTTGSSNTALGSQSLWYNTTGSNNTGLGNVALFSTTGGQNTALGYQSGYYNTTGSNNTYIGYYTDCRKEYLSNSTAIGSNAIVDASNQMVFGTSTEKVFIPGSYLQIGGTYTDNSASYALYVNGNVNISKNLTVDTNTLFVDASNNRVGIGTITPAYALDVSGNLGTTMDAYINTITVGRGGGNINSNTAIGYQALYSNIYQVYDIFNPGSHSGQNNTAMGYFALNKNTTGQYNTAIGNLSLYSNTTGQYNTSSGHYSLYSNTTGQYNTALGSQSLWYNTTGSNNTTLGYFSLFNTTGGQNTALGNESGYTNNTGSNNTYIGYRADCIDAVSNSTAIGYNAKVDASNQMVFGTSTEKVFIPGSYLQIGGTYNDNSASYALNVTGNVNISKNLTVDTNTLFVDASNNRVGIGTITPAYALDVSGNVNATSYNTPSDYRIKENVQKLDESFTIDNLKPVTYLNNKTEKQDIGLIAHELQEVYPFLVTGEKDGENLQSVNYIGLIAILIKEIQELKERVKTLESNPLF